MTAVGKILVFLNLILALVVGGFVVFTYVARTKWVEAVKGLQDQNRVLTASAETFKSEALKAQQDADAKVAKGLAEKKKVEDDLATQVAVNEELRGDLVKERKKSIGENANSTLSLAEVTKRQEDVAKLRENLDKETKENNRLVKDNVALKDEAAEARIDRQAAMDMNKRLEGQLQQMARDMAKMRASGGSTTTARAGTKNPPSESVEGLIKTTDASGLMTITIGSDAGLAKNHTLEVFRLSSIPSQSKYLGTVRVLEVTPTQAVCQPVGRMTAPPQAGDHVASRILGG
jgi:hypothetical protein